MVFCFISFGIICLLRLCLDFMDFFKLIFSFFCILKKKNYKKKCTILPFVLFCNFFTFSIFVLFGFFFYFLYFFTCFTFLFTFFCILVLSGVPGYSLLFNFERFGAIVNHLDSSRALHGAPEPFEAIYSHF